MGPEGSKETETEEKNLPDWESSMVNDVDNVEMHDQLGNMKWCCLCSSEEVYSA